MMVAPALAAATLLNDHGISAAVVNVPVIKPLDTATVLAAATAARVVVTAENHTIIGGLGSAVAETLAEAGLGRPLRRVGLQDTFAEGAQTAPYLFTKYGLTTQHLITTAWSALGLTPATPPCSDPHQPTPASTPLSSRAAPNRPRRSDSDQPGRRHRPPEPGRGARRGRVARPSA